MSLNASELSSVVDSLKAMSLEGALCQKVSEAENHWPLWCFKLRSPGRNHHLIVDLSPRCSRLSLSPQRPRGPQVPSAFTMLLRKHLIGARWIGIHCVEGERLVSIEFKGAQTLRLVAALTGIGSYIALLDESGRVLGGRRSAGGQFLQAGQELPSLPTVEAVRGPQRPLRTGWPSELEDVPFYVESLYADRHQSENFALARQALTRSLKRSIAKLKRRVRAIEADLEKMDRAPEYRKKGELLQSAWGKVSRGATEVRVTDFYDPELGECTIALDPALSLEANIERYFHRAKRLVRGVDGALERLEQSERALEALMSAQEKLPSLTETHEIEALEAALKRASLLHSKQVQARGKKDRSRRLCYRRFIATDGSHILVGRTNQDNDELTLRVARAHDIWLHAADFAGSHVILKVTKGGNPSSRALEEAALLAAFYSKAKENLVVSVHFLERKHIRKLKGMAPGQVTFSGGKAMDVRMDAPALQHLLKQRPE